MHTFREGYSVRGFGAALPNIVFLPPELSDICHLLSTSQLRPSSLLSESDLALVLQDDQEALEVQRMLIIW